MAVGRALHREEPTPTILDDYLALPLAGEEGPALIERLRAELPAQMLVALSRWACSRARLPEDIVERAVAEGIRQYVILGAGLDSFAYRRADLLDRLRVFEVDHPASQAWKQARLAELGIHHPTNLVFAPVDFETQTLRQGLEAAGFDFGAPAVFSWIGVTMYLTP
jgi:methyltransferase (TIGR00027 family)